MIQITNTLSGKKEPFVPIEPKKVRMYVCGPTVWGLTHIGNAFPCVFFDVVRRFFESQDYAVTLISNFTDVDDKIIKRAKEEGVTSKELAERFTDCFLEDMNALGVRPADRTPKVSETIEGIVKFIEGLVGNGSAYVAPNGEVFFSVRRFKQYGKLSKKKIDDLLSGARVEPGEMKKDPLDFSLWKPRKEESEPAWPSPWGLGRPGWHIECSVMAIENLGETFDIHGGGIDLIHPHHENEIAQSESLTGKPFAHFWMHNNHITMNSEKMSKSLGNIFLTREFIQKFSAETLRFLLLSNHYRSPVDFSERAVRDVHAALHRFYTSVDRVLQVLNADDDSRPMNALSEQKELTEQLSMFKARWAESMSDDFNTAKVIGFVFDLIRSANALVGHKQFRAGGEVKKTLRQTLDALKELSKIINILGEDPEAFLKRLREIGLSQAGLTVADIESAIAARIAAREAKDYATSDNIRDDLSAKGIALSDQGKNTLWDVVF